MNREELFDKTNIILKGTGVWKCPNCDNVINWHANPYYFYDCEHCGVIGNTSELIYISTFELFNELVDEYLTDQK
ncbi:MAG: hypothetical protein M0R17_12015 [Candidatus Omnitrophica bacterium]|jgi:hypothetical protein|nr:hypothetical protein [Candidatus Omnitrophota bacterium]